MKIVMDAAQGPQGRATIIILKRCMSKKDIIMKLNQFI